jgi:hypothetical protein
MAFTAVPDNAISLSRSGPELHVAWTSAAAVGTWFQGWVDGSLYWTGTDRSFGVPLTGSPIRVDVGAVAGLADRLTDYSGSLAALPAQRAALTWQGGSYEKATLAGFYVQLLSGVAADPVGTGGAGGSVLATVPAYIAGIALDGCGLGPCGAGACDEAASAYAWTSDRLPRGVHVFAVIPFDAAGNPQTTPATTSVTITAPPRAPSGLGLTYSGVAHTAALNWTRSNL